MTAKLKSTTYPVVAIVGGTFWGNRGAEAMLVTTIGKVRESFPDARFKVYTYYTEFDRQLVHDASVTICDGRPLSLVLKLFLPALLDYLLRALGVRIPDWIIGRDASALRSSNAVADIGGIVFADGRLVFLLYNIFTIWPAMLFGVPVVKLSQALGPFRSRTNRALGKLFLSRCKKIFARGADSFRHLTELGLSTEIISQASDIVFSYTPSYSLTDENSTRVQTMIGELRRSDRPIAAIIPSSLLYSKNEEERESYMNTLAGVAELFNARGYQILCLPNATREGSEKKRNNDIIVVNALRSRISGGYFVDFDLNTASIQQLLTCAQTLVTSRFHGMVAGLSLGIPTGVIGWGHKYREVLAEFNLSEFAADYRCSRDEVLQMVTRLLDRTPSVRERTNSSLPTVRSSSSTQFDYFMTLLAGISHTK